MDKVSDKYKTIEIDDVGDLAGEIRALASVFDNGVFHLVDLRNGLIGLCGNINTYARSKSTLQRMEPIVVAISRTNWHVQVPFAFSDNPNFPFDRFAHINYQHGDYPPTFCLSRENVEDWYAEHTLKEYIELVAQWLRDAARGKLMKINHNDEYEPQRLHNVLEHILMRASYMDSILENKDRQCDLYSIHIYNDFLAYGSEQNTELNSNAIGVRLFAGYDQVDNTWYHQYPNTLNCLYRFIESKKYPLDLNQLKASIDDNKKYVYFQLALLRPVKIIGKNTRINYLCFRVPAPDVLSDHLDASTEEVTLIDFTDYVAAKHLSKTPDSIFLKKICVLGCGAIGSKIAFHLYRSGISFLDLVDNDLLLPHNMVRHALSTYRPDSLVLDKASAMRKNMTDMFFGMPLFINSYNSDALFHISKPQEKPYDIIIDATASVHVMYGLDDISFPDDTRIVRVALSEGGEVGITYICIDGKQPFADYYMELLISSLANDDVFHWLSSERKNSTENIRVGEGCHSNTMRISDDTISSHAALMSSAIRHIYEGEQHNRIILSFANRDFPGSMSTCTIPVNPFQQYQCANDSSWNVRIPQSLLKDIRMKTKIAGQKENGGYLFGHIDYKRRIIYALIHFMPRDSRGTKSGFRLGTGGLKNYKAETSKRSIGQMKYIGDWHSHPSSTLDMSTIDIKTSALEVFPQLENGIGLCVITKVNDTKFFLISR